MTDSRDSDTSRTIAGYDALATAESDDLEYSPWGDSRYQEHYVWPAVRPLLPDVDGARVLDAGCGVGDHVGWFLDQGAAVVGVDGSETAIETARDRYGDSASATFHVADLTDPLSFAADDGFDLVFCNLVLDHIENWTPVFAEFERTLRPDGVVVLTTIHPLRRYRRHRDELTSYYETEAYVGCWGDTDAKLFTYHRPVGDVLGVLDETGFVLEEFLEAKPQPSYEAHNPERYERAMQEPDTLCVRARTGVEREGD
ncbi:MAG: class I SAM-dependent methyltransferase [Halopenitus sp.]